MDRPQTGKLGELIEEFRVVMTGRINWIDSVLPPLLFVVLYEWVGANRAAFSALLLALALGVLRWRQRRSVRFLLGGSIGVAAALLIVTWLGRAEGFFLPGMLSSGGVAVLAVISALARRPLVAWTSHIARRWPRAWYWHPRVRPAYSEVTWLWAVYFAARLVIQTSFFQQAQWVNLAWLQLLLGWPATVALLAVSYLYGTWRLQNLGGPSVAEFQSDQPPPWEGQLRGF